MPRTRKRNRSKLSKKKVIAILICVLSLVVLAAAFIKKPDKRINTSDAYGFNILSVKGDSREYNELRAENEVKKLSEMIDGRYKWKHWGEVFTEIQTEECYVLVPVRRDEYGNTDDHTYDFSSNVTSDDVFTPNGIYVLSEKEVAVWDENEELFWVGEKKGEPLDLEYIKALMKLGATDEDIEELEGAPAY